MSLDLALDDGQLAVADAVEQLCRDRLQEGLPRDACGLPEGYWAALAELGVLGLGAAEDESGAGELVAAHEALGRAAAPGPLVESVLAVRVLDGEERRAVSAGRLRVGVVAEGVASWGAVAERLLSLDEEGVHPAEATGPPAPLATLGGEPWARIAVSAGPAHRDSVRALAFADAALAAYLAGAAERLVTAAAEHARARTQFGTPLGDFQAVAHPLADARIQGQGAETLARAAAFALDAEDPAAPWRAAAARLSAREAALGAAHVAHQAFGAVGATLEGPVFRVSRRIRQLASHPLAGRRAGRGLRGAEDVLEAVLAGGTLA